MSQPTSLSERLVECVPNISEGRDARKIEQIVDAARAVEGVSVLDVDPGRETNRTVITLVGDPTAIREGAFRLVARAAELIDMSKHEGAHARHGATDVVPFVPVAGVTMDDCIEIAGDVGERIGRELGIPVYLYDRAARVPERRSLATVRAGEYEALPEKMKDPRWKPDFGPAEFHAKAGVVTVGAREFLIAYNVNLNTVHEDQASDIASEIREKGRAMRTDFRDGYYKSGRLLKYFPSKNVWPSGITGEVFESRDDLAAHYRDNGFDLAEELAFFGRDPEALEGVNVMKRGTFRNCRAVGWVIPEYGRAQISVNLTNFRVTSTHALLEECRRLATERGLVVTGSEIVGLVPWEALAETADFYLERQGSSRGVPVKDRVETAVQGLGLRELGAFDAEQRVLGMPKVEGPLVSMRLHEFADEVSRSSPAPGGGSVAALVGSVAAGLAAMVGNITHGKKAHYDDREELERIAVDAQRVKDDLLRAIDADTDAFGDVLRAMRMPKSDDAEKAARDAAIQAGYKTATLVPLATAESCLEAMQLSLAAAKIGLEASVTDAGVGVVMGRAGLLAGIYNVKINLGSIDDAPWVEDIRSKLGSMIDEADRLEREVRELLDSKLG